MLKLGNLLKCKQTRLKAIQANSKKENDEATGASDEQSGDTNNQQIDRSVGINNLLAQQTETIERSMDDAKTSTSPKRYSANIAYPFNDVKATSFPPPLSIDASVFTDEARNGQNVTEQGYVTTPRISTLIADETRNGQIVGDQNRVTTPRISTLIPRETKNGQTVRERSKSYVSTPRISTLVANEMKNGQIVKEQSHVTAPRISTLIPREMKNGEIVREQSRSYVTPRISEVIPDEMKNDQIIREESRVASPRISTLTHRETKNGQTVREQSKSYVTPRVSEAVPTETKNGQYVTEQNRVATPRISELVSEETKNGEKIREQDHVATPRISELIPERTSVYSKRKSRDSEDQFQAFETLRKSEQDEKDRSSKDSQQNACIRETCNGKQNKVYTLDTCVGPSTHKGAYIDNVYPTKLTEMINNSIKEAMQTIVKDCTRIPTVQKNGKLAPIVSEETEKSHRATGASICQNPQHVSKKLKNGAEPRAIREECHCAVLSMNRDNVGKLHNSSRYNRPRRVESPCGLTSMKVLTTDDNDVEKKSKRLTPKNVKTDNRRDNRRMTGNVNIYICSEANEGTQVTKKKKQKSSPCSATDSETTTERSTATCVRSSSLVSSKLVTSIRKKRQVLEKQEARNLSYSHEKSESHGNAEESSNSDSCTTKYRNCRLVAERESDDINDVCGSMSSELVCQNSISTLSTRDGCCCKDTVVSGTDLLIKQSQSSLPRFRYSTCVKENLVPCSTIFPTKDVASDENWLKRSLYESVQEKPWQFDGPPNILNTDFDIAPRHRSINSEILRSVYAVSKNVHDRNRLLGNNFHADRQLRGVNETSRTSGNIYRPGNVSNDDYNDKEGKGEPGTDSRERHGSYVNDVCKCRCKEPRGSINSYGSDWRSATRWRKAEKRSFGTSKENIQHWSACNCIAEEEEDYCSNEKKMSAEVEKKMPEMFTVRETSRRYCGRLDESDEKLLYVKTFNDTKLYPESDKELGKGLSKGIERNGEEDGAIEYPVKDTVEANEISKNKGKNAEEYNDTKSRASASSPQKEKLSEDTEKERVFENVHKEPALNNNTKTEGKETTENWKEQGESNELNNNAKLIANDVKMEDARPASLGSPINKSRDDSSTIKIDLKPKTRMNISEEMIDAQNKFVPKLVAPIVEQPMTVEENTKPQAPFESTDLVRQRSDSTKIPKMKPTEEIRDKESAKESSDKDVSEERPVTPKERLMEYFPLRYLKRAFDLIRHRKLTPVTKVEESPEIINGTLNKETAERAATNSKVLTELDATFWISTNNEVVPEIKEFADKENGTSEKPEVSTEVPMTSGSKIALSEVGKPMENDKLDDAERKESIRKGITENRSILSRTKLWSAIESAKKASSLRTAGVKELFPRDATVSSEDLDERKSEVKDAKDEKSTTEATESKRDTLTDKPQFASRETETETEKEQEEVKRMSSHKATERSSSASEDLECSVERSKIIPAPSYCYQPKIECQCETSRLPSYYTRPDRPVSCDVFVPEKDFFPIHPTYTNYCSLQKESNNTTIVPCISYQSTQNEYRCTRPIGCVCRRRAREECSCNGPIDAVGRRLRSKDDCKCRRSMICIYCENPRERCTCRSPIRKCSQCSLPLDICKCHEPFEEDEDTARRKDPRARKTVLTEDRCDDGKTMCVTAWKPNKYVRRYFAREREDVPFDCQEEYRYRQKLKPYGSDDLPYQRFSAFSDVMNELQQKISGSLSCACCRKVPCSCNFSNDRIEEMEEKKMKSSSPRVSHRMEQSSNNCKCGTSSLTSNQKRTVPTTRTCHACNVTPCKCRKSRVSQRKPRAKCYYCKSLPCACIGTKETSKSRPCRCGDSLCRAREKEIVPCGNPIVSPKDNDGKFVCVRGSNTRVCSTPKRYQRRDNSVNAPQQERKCR